MQSARHSSSRRELAQVSPASRVSFGLWLHCRLITTLTDHRAYPADGLTRLYHERWEIDSAFLALRHTMLDGLVLRSGDRPGVEQEDGALAPRALGGHDERSRRVVCAASPRRLPAGVCAVEASAVPGERAGADGAGRGRVVTGIVRRRGHSGGLLKRG
jgi:hypothetical protein